MVRDDALKSSTASLCRSGESERRRKRLRNACDRERVNELQHRPHRDHLRERFRYRSRFEELAEKYANDAPDDSVFDDDWNVGCGVWWQGEGSGSSFDALKDVLSSFDGEADLVLTWEGGDSHTGLRLRNHVVTEHEVAFALGKET